MFASARNDPSSILTSDTPVYWMIGLSFSKYLYASLGIRIYGSETISTSAEPYRFKSTTESSALWIDLTALASKLRRVIPIFFFLPSTQFRCVHVHRLVLYLV